MGWATFWAIFFGGGQLIWPPCSEHEFIRDLESITYIGNYSCLIIIIMSLSFRSGVRTYLKSTTRVNSATALKAWVGTVQSLLLDNVHTCKFMKNFVKNCKGKVIIIVGREEQEEHVVCVSLG
jgi:hypothetical protein